MIAWLIISKRKKIPRPISNLIGCHLIAEKLKEILPKQENKKDKKRELSPNAFSSSTQSFSKKMTVNMVDSDEEEEEQIAPTANVRPVCMYGVNCYRKNPQHFIEFAHPHLDNN